LAVIAVLFALVLPLHAAVPNFDDANRLYEQGKYLSAANAYREMLDAGTNSAAVWFNLGNAQFKAGHLGEAIAAYRQAERLAPRDADVRANLDFARRQVTGPRLRPGWLQRQMDALRTNEWTLTAMLPVWACFGLLVAMQIRPRWKPGLRRWAWLTGTAGACGCIALAMALQQRLHERVVVVNNRDTVVRAGPFEESPSAFTASDGAEFAVVDAKGDWCQISDGTRVLGWLPAKSTVAVR